MKNISQSAVLLLSVAAAMVLARPAVAGEADVVVNNFDKADEVQNWTPWFGDLSPAITFDRTKDAGNSTNSGSLKVTVKFNQAAADDNQFSIRGALGKDGNLETVTVDGAKYASVQFDLNWATNSPVRASGDMGVLDVGLVATDYSQVWLPETHVAKKDGWQHLTLPIKPSTNSLENIGGIVLKMWADDPQWGLTGTSTFWIDNVKLTAKAAPAAAEKPKADAK